MITIKAGWVICSWDQVIRDGVILIEDGKIIDILTEKDYEDPKWKMSPGGRRSEEGEVLEKRNSIVFPGFVNAHMHQYGVLSHGIPQSGKVTDFRSFLTDYWWPAVENRVGRKETLITARATMAEMIRSGITAFCDTLEAPCTEEDTLLRQGELIEQTGMRAVVSLESSQRISDENGWRCLEMNRRAAEFFKKRKGPVRGAICTHTTFTCSENFIRRAAEMAAETGCLLQYHLSESRYELDLLKRQTGDVPVRLYERAGALGSHVIASQCVKVTREEMELLKETGTKTVHMPVSNCEVGGGIAPVPDMLEMGIHTALGTDGYVNDFFTVMKEAFLIHKAARESTDPMPARLVFRMATEYGAEAVGLEHAGRIENGADADLIIYENAHPTPVNEENIYDQIVVYGSSAHVTDVMAAGRWLMRDRQLVTLDEEACMDEMRKCAEAFWQGAGVKGGAR